MTRWITFDDETAEAVVTRLRRGAAEIQAAHPVDAALRTEDNSIVLFPSPVPGRVLIAHFTNCAAAAPEPAVDTPSIASPIPPQPTRKPWWKKLVA